MRLIKKVVPSNFNLFLFGDVHIGARAFYEWGFDSFVDTFLSPFEGLKAHCNFGVQMGDAHEAILQDDPRFDPVTVDDKMSTPLRQFDYVEQKFTPIRKQLVAWLEGNHERKLWRFGNLASRMAGKLGVRYGGFVCKVAFVDKADDLLFKGYFTHGRKTITSTADDPKRRMTHAELILKRHMKFKAGDCALMAKGHTHKTYICRPVPEMYMYDDGEKMQHDYPDISHTDFPIHPDHRWYINTGSFLRLFGDNYDTYGEFAEYDPIELSYVVVLVRDRKIVDAKKVPLE